MFDFKQSLSQWEEDQVTLSRSAVNDILTVGSSLQELSNEVIKPLFGECQRNFVCRLETKLCENIRVPTISLKIINIRFDDKVIIKLGH